MVCLFSRIRNFRSRFCQRHRRACKVLQNQTSSCPVLVQSRRGVINVLNQRKLMSCCFKADGIMSVVIQTWAQSVMLYNRLFRSFRVITLIICLQISKYGNMISHDCFCVNWFHDASHWYTVWLQYDYFSCKCGHITVSMHDSMYICTNNSVTDLVLTGL